VRKFLITTKNTKSTKIGATHCQKSFLFLVFFVVRILRGFFVFCGDLVAASSRCTLCDFLPSQASAPSEQNFFDFHGLSNRRAIIYRSPRSSLTN
jgi:hypothetical protein